MQRSKRGKRIDRRYERFLIDLRLIVKIDAATLHGRTKNLAEGGMAATIAGDIPLGSLVELQFRLPESSESMALRAEVRYRQGFQYGFKFLPPTEEQLEIIRYAVRDLPVEE
jgi:hypothetical protein